MTNPATTSLLDRANLDRDAVRREVARGLAGEFGHLPFGDPEEVCGCGGRGCWGARFDPPRVAARLGKPDPDDPRGWLRELFAAADWRDMVRWASCGGSTSW